MTPEMRLDLLKAVVPRLPPGGYVPHAPHPPQQLFLLDQGNQRKLYIDGHPSLRHLYLPAEFEGYPLRKDFPLLAREVKPWPGIVDVEPMPGEDAPAVEAATAEVEA